MRRCRKDHCMNKYAIRLVLLALFVLTIFAPTADAKTGSVRVVFTKAALVAGGGVGRGVLTYDGREHRFRVYGVSIGVTIGVSVAKLAGRAAYLEIGRASCRERV